MKKKDLKYYFTHWSVSGLQLTRRMNKVFLKKNSEKKELVKKLKWSNNAGLHKEKNYKEILWRLNFKKSIVKNLSSSILRVSRILFLTKIFSFIFKKTAYYSGGAKYLNPLKKEAYKLFKVLLLGRKGADKKNKLSKSLLRTKAAAGLFNWSAEKKKYRLFSIKSKKNLFYKFKNLYNWLSKSRSVKKKKRTLKNSTLNSFFEYTANLYQTLFYKKSKKFFMVPLKFISLFDKISNITVEEHCTKIRSVIRSTLSKKSKKLFLVNLKKSKYVKSKFVNLYLQIACNIGGKNRIGFYDWDKNTIFSTNTKALGIKSRKLRINLVKSCFLFLRVIRLFKSKAWELRRLKNYILVTKSKFIAMLSGDVTRTYRLFRYLHARNKFMNFTYVRDLRRIPHNGCRLPKKRRKKNKGKNKYSKKNIML